MSLINDALKDLDSRSDDARCNSGERIQSEHVPEDRGTTSGSDSRRNWRYLVIPSTVLVGAFVLFDFYGDEPLDQFSGVEPVSMTAKAGASSPASETIESLNENSGDFDQTLVNKEMTVSDARSSGSKKEPPSSPDELQSRETQIALYLEKANTAITRNRLSVPSKGNALFFLAKVYELDPENTRARSMHQDIQSSYLAQIVLALDNHRLRRAETLMSRSGVFGLNDLDMETYQTRLSRGYEVRRASLDGVNNEKSISSQLGAAKANETETEVTAVALPGTVVSEVEPEKKKWVTVTSESEDLHFLTRIKERIRYGEEKLAIAELAARVKQRSNVLNSEIFLFDYYFGNSEFDKAQALLNSLDEKHIASDYFNAQLTHHFHGPVRAISILESSILIGENRAVTLNRRLHEKQSAFLAALYQKTAAYKKAQAIYAGLLREDQHNIQYVLGFALAADADGDRFSALTAYRKIRASGYENESVVAFVEKRIGVLEANDLAEATRW